MELSRLTSESLIELNSDLTSKEEIIKTLILKLYQEGKITSKEDFFKAVLERESLTPTGIDNGLAIPHGKCSAVKEASFAVMTLNQSIDTWESVVETNRVQYVFLLAIPESDAGSIQMQMLSELMTKIANTEYTNQLFNSETVSEFYQNLDREFIKTEIKSFDKSIVAVTACVAGIAHTYMAAEALINAGKELGIDVFVEKQGANGIVDKHTKTMLENAGAAIFAVDVAVKEEDRFSHLPIVRTKVSEPLKRAKEMILEAIDKAENINEREKKIEKGFLEVIKESVLTGINYVVPLIVVSNVISTLCIKMFSMNTLLNINENWIYIIKNMSDSLLGNMLLPILSAYIAYSIADKPSLITGFVAGICVNIVGGGFLVGIFSGVVSGYVMKYLKKIIPSKGVFAGVISLVIYPTLSCIAVSVILLLFLGQPLSFVNHKIVSFLNNLSGIGLITLGLIIGVMVSYDLGGSINKLAYVFCISAMADGVFVPYCVFAGVKMVSTFAVTFATKLKKELFTQEEIRIGNSSWLLGLSGITEGVIPFVKLDPKRMVFSLCVGSAICGVIISIFNIGLNVPGAGIFSLLFLRADNILLAMFIWLFSAILGAFISAMLIIVGRKKSNI